MTDSVREEEDTKSNEVALNSLNQLSANYQNCLQSSHTTNAACHHQDPG